MHNLIAIMGPTASGKTNLASHLAYEIGGEIISADSRQVYRDMNVGTGKDLNEYFVNGRPIPYHLIDIVEPGYEYNVYEFQRDFARAYNKVVGGGHIPILCGGTGLYIESVISGYQLTKTPFDNELRSRLEPLSDRELIEVLKSYGELHNTTDITDRKRTIRAIEIHEQNKSPGKNSLDFPDIDSINFGIHFERDEIRTRITDRLRSRLETGMAEEVKGLLESGTTPEQLMFYGLEYRFVTQFVTGQISQEEMFQLLNTAIHQFAKRQMTWFRRMERKGIRIIWIDGSLPLNQKVDYIKEYL